MKMLSFIQKYISNKRKKAQEELNNKPQYRIGDLYCGEIVLKLNETYIEDYHLKCNNLLFQASEVNQVLCEILHANIYVFLHQQILQNF